MSYGPEGEAFFCDVCQDDPKRCDKTSCPGAPHPDDPHTQAKDQTMTSATAETKGEWQWPKEWLDALQALHILPADGGEFQALAISPGPITCHKILEALASVGALARTPTTCTTRR